MLPIFKNNYRMCNTSEKKAAFIADSMSVVFAGFSEECYIMLECEVDETIFEVYDEVHQDATFFVFGDEAEEYYNDIVEDIRHDTGVFEYSSEYSGVTLSKNKLSFRKTISSEDMNVLTLSDLFDKFAHKDKEMCATAWLTKDGVKQKYNHQRERHIP